MSKLAFVLVGCLFLLIDFPISLPSAINAQHSFAEGELLARKKGLPSGRVGGGTRSTTPVLVEVVYV